MVRSRTVIVLLASASTVTWASPSPAEVSHWSGPYAGVVLGVNRTKADGSYTGIYPGPTPTPTGADSDTHTDANAHTDSTPNPNPNPDTDTPSGRRPQSREREHDDAAARRRGPRLRRAGGPPRFGAQFDMEYLGRHTDVISALAGTVVRDQVKVDWTAHALGRVGYDVGGGWLPYATGGAVWAHVAASHTGLVTPTQAMTWSQRNTRLSYTLGGGLEKQLAGGCGLSAPNISTITGSPGTTIGCRTSAIPTSRCASTRFG